MVLCLRVAVAERFLSDLSFNLDFPAKSQFPNMREVQVLVTGTTYFFSVHYKRMEPSSLFVV
jgi:hypothetical protein